MTVRSLLLILPVLALTACVQQANRDDKVLVQQAELGFDSCGFLEVPEDYSVLEGRRIKIAYCILKAKGSNNSKVPLIICTGGPGSAAISGVARWTDHPFRETHDIILFDQRGVGLSGALPTMGSALFAIMAADLNLSEEFTAVHDTLMRYKSQIEATGVDIGSYNTRNNATDVNAIMNHLNYPQYILYGESYGTKLVRTVLDVYPEKIKSVILDSPAIPENDFLLMRLQNLSNALEAIFQFCSKDSACNALTPDLREDFLAGAKSLETKPIHIQKVFVIPCRKRSRQHSQSVLLQAHIHAHKQHQLFAPASVPGSHAVMPFALAASFLPAAPVSCKPLHSLHCGSPAMHNLI
jgi:pimeloyl-ACP methyl ester carboxylesterase